MQDSARIEPHSSRRNFLTTSAGAVVAGAALERAIAARSYAGEEHTIPIALVGCGGRGTGAATQALSTKGPTRLVAMADVFEDRLKDSLDQLTQQHSPQLEVARDGSSSAPTPTARRSTASPRGASSCWPHLPRSGRFTSSTRCPGAVMCSWKSRSALTTPACVGS